MLIALNKPYGVVCQFSAGDGKRSLADLVRISDVYPAGRLDSDSEGLVLLTDDGRLQHLISSPTQRLRKRYWVQVEHQIEQQALSQLSRGVLLADGMTRPTSARALASEPDLWARDPPIRVRQKIPTSWIELALIEGRNRQVRRMTAAVGYPTLRLVRVSIGNVDLFELGLAPGVWREISPRELGPGFA